ncbi:hypothetical protein LAZ67_X000557 [Cordylochernes scorpioides]|uniref:Uncharacterized protein n=1 Tax=Cordylochernes scorpioides TaxID=51811 RepID=A0ABY6LS45_9ARAC|nr:hypothetical protein LAZ67_X000557 [Cordylochernes scorpioides]
MPSFDCICKPEDSEVKRIIALGRETMTKLNKIMKGKGISFKTKKKMVETLVFTVVNDVRDGGSEKKKK